MGEADIAEEVARTYGYRRIARRMPSWPQPGRLTEYQRDRRLLKRALCGVGASEAWTTTFVSETDQIRSGFDPPYMEVTNPLVESERFLRSSMAPGLIRAVLYNTERRQGNVRLFEVGTVFIHPDDPPAEPEDGPPADTPERVSAVFAGAGDDAWTAVAAWRIIADTLGIADWVMGDRPHLGPASRAVHRYRSASISSIVTTPPDEYGITEHPTELGLVGELDPTLVGEYDLVGPDGRPRRVGWLDLDIGVLLDRERVPRRDGRRPTGRRGSPPRTSTSPLWSRIRFRPDRWSGRWSGPEGSCWSPSSCSTCSGDRACRMARGAWPSTCDSARWTAPSPTRRSAGCGPDASTPSRNATTPPLR